jgi:hypothetical protein
MRTNGANQSPGSFAHLPESFAQIAAMIEPVAGASHHRDGKQKQDRCDKCRIDPSFKHWFHCAVFG